MLDEHDQILKLIEYTKIWSLARRFLLTELKGHALYCVERAGPCVDDEGHPKTGSTLADFLRYAYYEAPDDQRSELHSIAIQKAIKLTCPECFDEVYAGGYDSSSRRGLSDKTFG